MWATAKDFNNGHAITDNKPHHLKQANPSDRTLVKANLACWNSMPSFGMVTMKCLCDVVARLRSTGNRDHVES
jgi:hypothetical protein